LASIVSKSISAISHKEKKLIYDKWMHKESSTQDKATHITLSEQENQWLKNHKTITFSGDPNWLPFEAFNDQGEYIGIVADYLHQIEKNVPLKFNPIQTQDWSETIAHAKVGDIDVISDVIDSAPLKKHYVPIPAYIKSPIVIVMREGHTFVNDLEEIDNKKIALIAEYGYNEKVKKTYPDILFSYEENADEAMLSLSLGKIDAILLSLPKAQYLLGVQGYNNINIVGKTKVTMGLTLFVRKDKPHLHSILQKTMKELVNTRHLDIFSKWQKVKFAEKVDYTLVYKILALFLFFVLGTWYWYRKLNYEVLKRKASEEQMSMMIETIPLNVIVSGLDGSVLRANAFSLKTFSVSAEDIYGHNVMEFYVLPEEREDIIKTIQQEGKVRKRIVKFKRFDNSEMDIMISIIPIIYNEEKALLSIMVDLTERIKMEEDLRDAKEVATLANKSKSDFLANMSHEIRTPMNAIMGFTELLSNEIKETRHKSYIKTIKNAGNTLLTLINDILDLSKIEAGKLDIHKRAINVYDLSEEVLSIFMMSVRNKDLDLLIDIDEDVPKSLLLDDTRLRQVLVNLIGNAVKFTDEGYIKLKISVMNVDDHLSKLDLLVVVEDTGIGIPKDQLTSIFHSFEQKVGQDNRQYGGTGLGLTISKRLTEMMDGIIHVESKESKGSKFSLQFKNVDILSIEVENNSDTEQLHADNIVFEPAKILVVDDIADNLELIVQSFEGTHLKMITATDGYKAITQYENEKPDLILMDIRMPHMDGYEAAKKIKSIDKNVPIIALTASVMKDEYERSKSKDFDAYLRKPVLRDELYLSLSHFLEHETVVVEEHLEEKTSFYLDKKVTLNVAKIVDEMHRDIAPLHEKSSRSNNMAEIKLFSSKVHAVADKYEVDVLEEYASKLDEAIESFDINQMKLLLKEYSALQEKFELL
jgi:two-component system sensor histidine kinase EvgS